MTSPRELVVDYAEEVEESALTRTRAGRGHCKEGLRLSNVGKRMRTKQLKLWVSSANIIYIIGRDGKEEGHHKRSQ